jgi:HD-GYP domain-containing protein (c-di-GMP phosphodiesterase class II)
MHPENFETSEMRLERARGIVRTFEFSAHEQEGPYDLRFSHILEELKRTGLLTDVCDYAQKNYTELSSIFDEHPEECWEMLAVLHLFDEGTAQHSVETYEIARKKIEKFSFANIPLKSEICEKIDLPTFYRACLLHDIGKIEVPYSIIVNRISDIECAQKLFEHKDILLKRLAHYLKTPESITTLPDTITSPESLLTHLLDVCHVRPQALAPVSLLLGNMSEADITSVQTQLNHCGKSLDDSLIDIMHTHDEYSERILETYHMPTEAILAGSHHKSSHHEYKIAIGAIQVTVDLSHIIHLADVQNAILSARSYKGEQTPISALKILATHAERGYVDSYITYIWIADELRTIQKIQEGPANLENDPDYTYVIRFLDKTEKNHLAYPHWTTEQR